jgi:hypothetical protein
MSPTAAPGPARRASREQPQAAGSARRTAAAYAAAAACFEGCGRGRMREGHACAWGARAGPSYIRNGLPRSQQAVTVNPGSGLASICAHAGSRANRASQDRLDTQYKGQHPLPAPFEALVGKRHGTTSPANNLQPAARGRLLSVHWVPTFIGDAARGHLQGCIPPLDELYMGYHVHTVQDSNVAAPACGRLPMQPHLADAGCLPSMQIIRP